MLADATTGKDATLGKYEIRRLLGRGAMGTVHEGWDTVLLRRVAIKTVSREIADESLLTRFLREARAAARITHPNIAGVYDYGETSDCAYIAMEFIDGPSLKTLLDQKEPMPPEGIARIMEDLLRGLACIHENGAVHRDIKPANLMLTQGGQTKIVDFGIARLQDSNLTEAGTAMGTPAYMAPEQFIGEGIDSRCDIHAAGVVLFQLLTGRQPFGGDPHTIMYKVIHAERPPPSSLTPGLSPALDAVVLKAIARDPDDRHPGAEAFAIALKDAFEPPNQTEAGVPARTDETPRPSSRRRWPLLAAAALLIAGGFLAREPLRWVLSPVPAGPAAASSPFHVIREAPGPEMVEIPAGTFMMGIPPEESQRGGTGEIDKYARPLHTVTFARAFWLSQYPITRGEYAVFANETKRPDRRWESTAFPQDDRHPVVNVNHADAEAYCAWLSGKTGQHYRLPGEAEWEYAARAGTTTARYWGDAPGKPGEHAHFGGGAGTRPVGSSPPNAFGLYDTLGDAWQWTADRWHDDYNGAPDDGSAWTDGTSAVRVIRGGSWVDNPRGVRSGYRGGEDPGLRIGNIGFRCARSAR